MQWVENDGGRVAAGFRGRTGDNVTRAIAIATGRPYIEVYDALNQLARLERPRTKRRSSARKGVHRKTYDRYLASLGWTWTPTVKFGEACTVHLDAKELPAGRLIVKTWRLLFAVIDGVVHDREDPDLYGPRCVYGYWRPPATRSRSPAGSKRDARSLRHR